MLTRRLWGPAMLLAGIASLLLPPAFAFADPPTVSLWATREGLVGQTTANGHVIVERDRFVALPSRRALNALGRRDYVVRLEYRGRTTEAPVWDVGPWNIHDDFWNERREWNPDLPRWTTQAESAFFQNHNGGRDGFGRYVTIPTSIDLADGTFWDDLGMTANDWVRVTFLWLNAPPPPPKPMPVVVPKRAPETAPPIPVAPPPPATTSQSTLSASPNPVPSGLGRGTSTISWDTGDGSFGRVYVWQHGGSEMLFGEGGKGSADAAWIQPGYTYEFRLYRGTTRSERLRTLTVTGNSARPTATPAPSPTPTPAPPETPIASAEADFWASGPPTTAEAPTVEPVGPVTDTGPAAEMIGEAMAPEELLAQAAGPWIAAELGGLRGAGMTVSWDTGDGVPGRVYVWQQGGGEVQFAEGPSGSAPAPWVQPGWTYEFRLYRGTERSQRLGTIIVSGPVGLPIRLTESPDPPPLEAGLDEVLLAKAGSDPGSVETLVDG